MKICLLVRRYPKSLDMPIVSGEVKNAYYLAQGLQRFGHDVSIVSDGNERWEGDIDGIHVVIVGPGIAKGVFRLLSVDLRSFRVFMRLFREKKFDVVHAHIASPFMATCRCLSTQFPPLVVTAHGTGTPEFRTQIAGMKPPIKNFKALNNRLMHHIDRYAWGNSDLVISAGMYQVEEMIKEYGILRDKIRPISNGVDTSFYRPSRELRQKFRQQYDVDDKEVILFVGRLTRKKGLQVLAEAVVQILDEIPNVIFFVIGGTDYFADYESQLRTLILDRQVMNKFVILKNVPERDMPGFYNMANVCVVPSIEYEPLPTVVFEAMATGIPVVGSRLGGIQSQVGYDDALIEPNQPGELASKLIEILSNDECRIVRGEYNRQRAVDRFNLNKVVSEHLQTYSDLIRQKDS